MAPPIALVRTVQSVRRGLSSAHRALQPAEYTLLEIVTGKWRSAALEAITRTGVADALYHGPRTASELATELGLHEEALYRLLRALASDGLLDQNGRSFALTSITKPLAGEAPNSMKHAVLSAGSAHNRSLWANIELGLTSEKPVFDQVHGETFWQYLAAHPDEADEFDASMAEYTREASVLIGRSYDFGRFESLADVGGGAGELLAAILIAHPSLRGVNFDLPHAVRRAPATFAKYGVEARATILEGSAFDGVPEGHDAYLLKNVLHEMLDDDACIPLRHIRNAIRPGGRLFIVENVVPENGGPYLQYLDLVMWLGSGGKERTFREFATLLERAGFELERAIENVSPMTLLVAKTKDRASSP